MARAKRLAARVAVIAITATGCVCAATTEAAAAAPRGTLTASEYQQLTAATAALDKSASAKAIDWPKARAACGRVSRTTALLRTQRATCFGSVNVLDALASFPAEQRGCPRTSATTTTTTTTTTTGATTTTPSDSPAIQVMICMNPHYQALSRDAKVIDSADVASRKQALERGFSGACLTALAPTAAELATAKRFAASTAKLAADVVLLSKVTSGKLPAGDFNQTNIDNDVKLFEDSATAVLIEHGQPALSVCPHQ
jgi:hypothetical protein